MCIRDRINSSGGGDSADGSSISNGSLWRRLLLGDGNSAGVSNGAGEEDELPTPLSFLETLLNPQYSSSSSSLSLIHISEPTRLLSISYAVFCLKKKKKNNYLAIISSE
eukprot:TRINITY_DN31965_c0_g1_i1.p1 TRINITY_DN31965_c0_g1~~TRINITY_DN31965_c0_g1_i1.p1  ORF type:complete len:109 (-),score=39.71 TRINITY_DN31965_c0_g1_i1:27-353(-)